MGSATTTEDSATGQDVPLGQRRRVAQLLRDLAREVTTADVDDGEFASIGDALESVHSHLSQRPRLVRRTAGLHEAGRATRRVGREPIYDRDPLVGLSNPLAPPLREVESDGARVWDVTFGDAYEGHPGLVHGGYVAAVIDHVLGVTASRAGSASMTGTLTTRYRRPTPIRTRLVCTGRVTRVDGRKVFCEAHLEAEGAIVADAEGVYFRLDPSRT
jgi:acyl-coenzyme A thioesterase PaaI-like protein